MYELMKLLSGMHLVFRLGVSVKIKQIANSRVANNVHLLNTSSNYCTLNQLVAIICIWTELFPHFMPIFQVLQVYIFARVCMCFCVYTRRIRQSSIISSYHHYHLIMFDCSIECVSRALSLFYCFDFLA